MSVVSIKPARGCVLLKRIQTAEALAGSRILLPESVREGWSSWQYEIVAVGEPTLCEDEDCEQPHWKIPDENPPLYGTSYHWTDARITCGAWVYIKPRSALAAGTEEELYFCRQADVLGVFEEER